jgi:uncharacterized protein (TIGR03790 family)
MTSLRLLAGYLIAVMAFAQTGGNVLLVVNKQSRASVEIGKYYAVKRAVPPQNICTISTEDHEEIDRFVYERDIEKPIGNCLTKAALQESVLYIVTTLGVPLKVSGTGEAMKTTQSAVDSELTLLYRRLKGNLVSLEGPINNPYFGHVDVAFRHPNFPLYLVTRLAGFDVSDAKGLIDRSLAARDVGNYVIDVRADNNTEGNGYLRQAAQLLPRDRLIVDDTAKVLYDLKGVIGYASWGFNDPDRHRRTVGFEWLPGAIATEFVSNSGRTFARPPQAWTLGNWKDSATWFAGSPQDLSTDFVHEGVTGVSGHVYEPYLYFCPRPNLVLPAYAGGRNLAESFYLGIAGLSWQNIVIGDPLCKLRQ